MEIGAGDIIVAERVADIMSDYGYAYIEEEQAAGLAASIRAFLRGAGIQACPEEAEKYARKAGVSPVNP